MRLGFGPLFFCFLLPCAAFPADSISPADVLQKVSRRYKSLTNYQIEAETEITVARGGQTGADIEKRTLAVAEGGRFRVERIHNGVSEFHISDGKITWKALPSRKVWSKTEVAQLADSDRDEDLPEIQSMGQDLFTQTLQSFVTRYTGLARFAALAKIEKSTRLKFNGVKLDCYVVRIQDKRSTYRLFIAKDSFFVIRQVDNQNPTVEVTTNYKEIREGIPRRSCLNTNPQPAAGK